jgi:acetyl-CoA carboxylase biotin carboxyl carrier protein
MKIELDYIEKLVKLVSDNELTELSLEEGDKAVIIRKEKEIITTTATVAAQPVAVPTAAPVAVPAAVKSVEAAPAAAPASNLLKVTSPMVGTFYKAPAPDAAPFAEVGKSVNAGQVVCIIEAMKLMNEIESEVSGKVVEICVQDGEPVEYGQVLMLIEP